MHLPVIIQSFCSIRRKFSYDSHQHSEGTPATCQGGHNWVCVGCRRRPSSFFCEHTLAIAVRELQLLL